VQGKLTKLIPGLPSRKQEFGNPSLQPSLRCQTHASLPTRTPPSSGLVKTRKLNLVYQDFLISTTLSQLYNS